MGIMVYSLLWVMQDFVHQPYLSTKHNQETMRANVVQALSGLRQLCRETIGTVPGFQNNFVSKKTIIVLQVCLSFAVGAEP